MVFALSQGAQILILFAVIGIMALVNFVKRSVEEAQRSQDPASGQKPTWRAKVQEVRKFLEQAAEEAQAELREATEAPPGQPSQATPQPAAHVVRPQLFPQAAAVRRPRPPGPQRVRRPRQRAAPPLAKERAVRPEPVRARRPEKPAAAAPARAATPAWINRLPAHPLQRAILLAEIIGTPLALRGRPAPGGVRPVDAAPRV